MKTNCEACGLELPSPYNAHFCASTTATIKTIGPAAPYLNLLDLSTCKEIQNHLKEKYGLGTFNLSLPFQYVPNDTEARSY